MAEDDLLRAERIARALDDWQAQAVLLERLAVVRELGTLRSDRLTELADEAMRQVSDPASRAAGITRQLLATDPGYEPRVARLADYAEAAIEAIGGESADRADQAQIQAQVQATSELAVALTGADVNRAALLAGRAYDLARRIRRGPARHHALVQAAVALARIDPWHSVAIAEMVAVHKGGPTSWLKVEVTEVDSGLRRIAGTLVRADMAAAARVAGCIAGEAARAEVLALVAKAATDLTLPPVETG